MTESTLALISLIFLVGAIALGFGRKLNVGIVAIGFALVLGKLAMASDRVIFNGFSASMFVTLTGVTYLFSIAQANGTLELMAKKIVSLAGRRTALIPVAMFILGFIISAMGPGPIPTHALVAAFGVPLALQMKANPIFICVMGQLGAMAGCGSPLSPTAVIGENLSADAGIANVTIPMFASTAICFVIFAIFVYVFIYKGYKLVGENPIKRSELPKFDRDHTLTLFAMVVMAVIVLLLKYNVGLVAFFVAVVLNLIGVGDERESLRLMPWGTILMVCGVGVLMELVISFGGIAIVVNGLTSIMNDTTVIPFFGAASGILSWFSSTSGVVMPTMIPTIPDILLSINANPSTLVVAIVVVANCAGLSPASSAGGQVLANYTSQGNLSTAEANKVFSQLFAISALGVVFMSILGFLGLFGIFC